MAAVESLGSAEAAATGEWLVLRGTLREADLDQLLDRTTGIEASDVTIDLLSLDRLTPGGCWTLRNLAEHLWHRGIALTVLFRAGDVADTLRESGTFLHRRMAFLESPVD